MVSYKDVKATKKYYVLIKEGLVIGLSGNLKKICEIASTYDSNFPSYWTLIRKKTDRFDWNKYSIQTIVLS